MIPRFVFIAEPDPARKGWQIVHYVGDDRLVSEERFHEEADARAWASMLNAMAEPDPTCSDSGSQYCDPLSQVEDPAWWQFDRLPWDYLFPVIQF
jgi:hypothetical protein